jgi:hypothetical protein
MNMASSTGIRRSPVLLLGAIMAVLSLAATAPAVSAVNGPCVEDAAKFCKDVKPAG